jgi:hypothetical protein
MTKNLYYYAYWNIIYSGQNMKTIHVPTDCMNKEIVDDVILYTIYHIYLYISIYIS